MEKINITGNPDTNVDWYADGERANAEVLNRPIKQLAGFVNTLIDDHNSVELRPNIKPTLNLDFANGKSVDPRVTFTRPTIATYFDQNGVLRIAQPNEPRIDFDPSTLACRGLLIEEQRTNLLLWSQGFDNASWSKFGVTVTANAVVAPDRTLTAYKLVENTANTAHVTFQDVSVTASSTLTFSVYLKAAERSYAYIEVGVPSTGDYRAVINLLNGSVVSSGAAGTGATFTSVSVSNAGGGWYRVVITGVHGSAPTARVHIYLHNGISQIYTGDGTSGIYIWGAQLEAGDFPTSYIPTTTAQVTRARDTAFLPTSNWMTFQQGTMLFDFEQNLPVAVQTPNAIYFGAYQNSALVNGQDQGWVLYNKNNYLTRNPTHTTPSMGEFTGRQRVIISLDETGKYGTKNGEPVVSVFGDYTKSGTPPVFSLSGASTTSVNQHIRRIAYWPKRLPNETLQVLTKD